MTPEQEVGYYARSAADTLRDLILEHGTECVARQLNSDQIAAFMAVVGNYKARGWPIYQESLIETN